MIIVLHAAAKISHRAQALASITSKWHALVTCNSNNVGNLNNGGGNNEATNTTESLTITYSENDLESADFVPVPTNAQLASSMSLYHKRQALGMSTRNSLLPYMILHIQLAKNYDNIWTVFTTLLPFLAIKCLTRFHQYKHQCIIFCCKWSKYEIELSSFVSPVSYMQSNIGGASVFGWRIDRTLCNTIFFIELSLVLFVLGKTITF